MAFKRSGVRSPLAPPKLIDKKDACSFYPVFMRVSSLSKAILRGSNSKDAFKDFRDDLGF
jgi:hypothetical protein